MEMDRIDPATVKDVKVIDGKAEEMFYGFKRVSKETKRYPDYESFWQEIEELWEDDAVEVWLPHNLDRAQEYMPKALVITGYKAMSGKVVMYAREIAYVQSAITGSTVDTLKVERG